MVMKTRNIKGTSVKGVYEFSILFSQFLCKVKIRQNKKQKESYNFLKKKKRSIPGPTFLKSFKYSVVV